MKYLYIVLFNGLIYAIFGWWTTSTDSGKSLKHFLQTWKSDSFLHLVMVAVSIFIWGTAAILGLGLGLQALGL
jgi:hypothetical protein